MSHPSAPARRFYSLWAINAPLEQRRLRRQLDQFRAAGLDGVVFHPRFYPGAPPYLSGRYFDEVSNAILHAKSIGLAFWLYDENGWPSGAVGGRLLEQFPEHAQRWVGLFKRPTHGCLIEFGHQGRSWCLAERKGPGVDYLDPGLTRRFIQMTYEGYHHGLSPEAFAYVETFFCDEPEFGLGHIHHDLPPDGAIPWSPRLPQLYRERYGGDLIPLLPALFFPLDGHAEVRIRFYQLLNDLFCEAFISPLDAWCRAHGKSFTAHVKGEEHPLFQVPLVGACHPIFRRLSLPGIDALERFPSNDYYPRQVSSAARQFGDGRCMVEAFGGAGWGATPGDLERYLLWLGRHGLTDFVIHLSQYRLDSAAIQDWPPSQPLHLSWSEVYPRVLDRVRREIAAHPRPPADTLVVAPQRGIMANYAPWELMQTNIHNAATYPATGAGEINTRFLELIAALHRKGVAYDVTDERTLEQFAAPAGHRLKLGNCQYDGVIIAEGCRIEPASLPFLQPLMERAGARSRTVSEPPIHPIAPPVEDAMIPLHWKLETPPINSLLLECTPQDGPWFKAEFAGDVPFPHAPQARLLFADHIEEVILNGTSLPPEPLDDGTAAPIPWELLRPANTVLFRTQQPVPRPFAWLQGTFRVASLSPYDPGPANTVKTQGPFVIRPGRTALEHDLVTDGFPFLGGKLSAVSQVEFPRPARALLLDGLDACAVRLTIDANDLGWTWPRNGKYQFAGPFPAGMHTIRIELIPNSYNIYGPHHYYNGDWHVISPDQMRGIRNFADAPGAPESTHLPAWHFRALRLPSTLNAISKT